jgi:hypothetical protein
MWRYDRGVKDRVNGHGRFGHARAGGGAGCADMARNILNRTQPQELLDILVCHLPARRQVGLVPGEHAL